MDTCQESSEDAEEPDGKRRADINYIQCHCEKCQGCLVYRTTAYRHTFVSNSLNEQQHGDLAESSAGTCTLTINANNQSSRNDEPDQHLEPNQEFEPAQDSEPDQDPEPNQDPEPDQNAEPNQEQDEIKKFVLRTLKNKVRFGWSREETLSQLQNFYEYNSNEDVPHKSWQDVLAFLKNLGYHNPTVYKVCFAEDHVQLLYENDGKCPICDKERNNCIDYYVLGINLEDMFVNESSIKEHMAHWEERSDWFNKDSPTCPRKELWHGQRFLELSYFWDENKESPLAVRCEHCNSIISVTDIERRRTELGIDDEHLSFEYTCCECYTVFELTPVFMRGCPLNQAFVFHEDGFNAFIRRSRSIATIQISHACSHKQSRSTSQNFQVYSFIPTVHLNDGIVHKLDAFFQPLIDNITDLYLHGKILNLEHPININGHVLAAGEHCVRALLLLGTADLKAHQDIALYTGGGKKGCRKCLVCGTYIPEKRHYYYGDFGVRYRDRPQPRSVEYLYEHGCRCDNATNPALRREMQLETGVKGVTILYQLYKLYGFDPVKDMVVDRMHLCFNLLKREFLYKIWPELGGNQDKDVNERQPEDGGLINRGHFANSFQAVDWTTEQQASGVARLTNMTENLGGWKTAEFNKFSQVAKEVLALHIPSKAYDCFILACSATQMLYCKQLRFSGWTEESIKRLDDLLWAHAIRCEQFYGLSFCTENLEYSTHMAHDIRRHSSPDNYTCEVFERGIRTHKQQKHNAKGLEKTFTDRECLRHFLEVHERKHGPLSQYEEDREPYRSDLNMLEVGNLYLHERSIGAAKALIDDLHGRPDAAHALATGVVLGKVKRKLISRQQQQDITRYLQRLYPHVQVEIPSMVLCPKAVAKLCDFDDVIKFKVGNKCVMAGGENLEEEWFVEIQKIMVVGPLDGKYFTFVDCLYYIPGFLMQRGRDVAVHDWTRTNKLVPRKYNRDSVQPAANLKRKCIMYPDPENLDNPDYYLPIDFEKPDISSKVQVPVVPRPRDNLKIKGTHNEYWYARVITVDLEQHTALIKWYLSTNQQNIWTLSDNEDNINFHSIVSLVNAIRAPGGPRKFRFADA